MNENGWFQTALQQKTGKCRADSNTLVLLPQPEPCFLLQRETTAGCRDAEQSQRSVSAFGQITATLSLSFRFTCVLCSTISDKAASQYAPGPWGWSTAGGIVGRYAVEQGVKLKRAVGNSLSSNWVLSLIYQINTVVLSLANTWHLQVWSGDNQHFAFMSKFFSQVCLFVSKQTRLLLAVLCTCRLAVHVP